MKRTYTGSLTHKTFDGCTFKLYISEYSKYDPDTSGGEIEVEYKNVVSFDIIEGGKEAEEIEAMTDASGVDENHEYLALHFADGSESTFRNSHVDMFVR